MDAAFKARSWWGVLPRLILIGLVFVPSPGAMLRRAGVPVGTVIVLTIVAIVVCASMFFVARWSGLTSALTRWFDSHESAAGEELE
ncbi:hypothetical protein [Microbacterium mangrovi]|nr:hypothetical protein [Microbacterium mangrovi]